MTSQETHKQIDTRDKTAFVGADVPALMLALAAAVFAFSAAGAYALENSHGSPTLILMMLSVAMLAAMSLLLRKQQQQRVAELRAALTQAETSRAQAEVLNRLP